MSAVLYHGEPNGPSLAVLAALAESGLEIECRRIDLLAGDRHRLPGVTEPIARDLSVEGEGPVLVVDGEAMCESVFLAQYLDELAGGCGLQPKDAYKHWEMMMWCRQITERLAPAAALLGCMAQPDAAFAGVDAPIVGADLKARWQSLHDGAVDAAQVADSEGKVASAVQRCEAQLGPNESGGAREWLMGSFSIADLETYGWLAGMQLLRPAAFEGAPLTIAWLARVKSRPSVQVALGRATVEEPLRAWAPGPEINRWG